MTAILKDWKGFTSSMEVPYFQPFIRIPIYHKTIPEYELTDPMKDPRSNASTLTFRFKDWYKEKEIALYEQETT